MPEILPNWHPIFVHFTVALFVVAVLGFCVTAMAKTYNVQYQSRLFARWSLWLGFVATIATVAAGIYAYYTVAHDTPSHIVMTTHRNLAIGFTAVFAIMAVWSIVNYRTDRDEGKAFLFTALVGLVLLGATAWHGGELVFRYGIGVESLPQSTGEGHNHDHGDGGHDHGSSGSSTLNQERETIMKDDADKSDHSHDDSAGHSQPHTH